MERYIGLDVHGKSWTFGVIGPSFGDLALTGPDHAAFFGAISFGCGSLDAAGKSLDGTHPGCRMRRSGEAIQVAVDPFNALLAFRA